MRILSAHVPPKQPALAQSASATHFFPLAQAGQLPPPQSASDSVPSTMPSAHVGVTHVPAGHARPTQSEGTLHVFPTAHAGHGGAPMVPAPPQSASVSIPSCTPSVHVAAQVPVLQSMLAQSVETTQPCPPGQGGQVGPPQSAPVSIP